MRIKSLGLARGLANARPPGNAKFANAPPSGLTRWANAPQYPGAGGGGGCWAQLELTDALLWWFEIFKRYENAGLILVFLCLFRREISF